MLVSAAQQSDSDIYIFFIYINIHRYIYNSIYSFFFFLVFFSMMVYHRILNIVLCALQ